MALLPPPVAPPTGDWKEIEEAEEEDDDDLRASAPTNGLVLFWVAKKVVDVALVGDELKDFPGVDV